jgi:serine/threonine protein kinase
MPLQPGQIILNGKYHLLRLIGEGGMARVWLAEEPGSGGHKVAIKEPSLAQLGPDEQQELDRRFRQEIKLARQLEQADVPNVVRTYTVERLPDGTQLLVMEYMPERDLAALLKKHPDGLQPDQAVRITLDLLQALEGVHAHELEIVHRDVKPSNVLFDEQGRAHLADFGLAQLAGVSGRSRLAGGPHPGTPLYMAPEQGRSPDPLTPAADLYALGCLLFEMLTGQRYRRVRPGTGPSSLRPEVPSWLDDLVAKAVAEDPWERYQSAGEMAADLARQESRKEPFTASRLWWGGGIVLLVALIGAVVWLIVDGPPPPPPPPPTQTVEVTALPTASPTVTRTQTSTPTPVNTPTPTAMPSKTPQPPTQTVTATAAQPWFGPISFCLQIDAQNRCINPTAHLPAGTTKFYVSWEFRDVPYGAPFDRYWYHDGRLLKKVADTWDSAWGSPTGVEYTYYHYAPGFASGEYRLDLYLYGELLQSGTVRIGP